MFTNSLDEINSKSNFRSSTMFANEGRPIHWMNAAPGIETSPPLSFNCVTNPYLTNCQTVKHTFPTASLNWTAPKRKQWGHRSETCAFHISWIGHSGISAWFKKNFRRRGSLSTLSTCLTICQFHNKFSTEFFCGILFRTVTCLIPWNINKLYQTNIFSHLEIGLQLINWYVDCR